MKYAYVGILTAIFVLIQYSFIEYPIVLAVVNTILMINSLWLIWSYYEKSK